MELHIYHRTTGSFGHRVEWDRSSDKSAFGFREDCAGTPDADAAADRLEDLQAELAGSSEQRRLLGAELQHRSQNLIAVIQTYVLRTLATTASTSQAADRISERLVALSTAYRLLARPQDGRITLKELVCVAFAGHRVPDDRLSIEGPTLYPVESGVIGLAMVLQELITNATKYGALSVECGSVRVGWQLDGKRVDIVWQEEGGPPVSPPSRFGFGTELIERALRRADRRVEILYGSDGVSWTFSSPLAGFASTKSTSEPFSDHEVTK
ncbi:sensor histidine kinase [Sphingomonas faeni]|uniref:sensor histidine kinase n=1 Tax=Sphingomonas faeni TaxID=185950 RepID=UPI00334B8FE1